MDALLEWGYRTITFEQWLEHSANPASVLPDKPLIVTFDDGYTCFDEHAWPVLKARGMSATVFLVADQIGGTNAWERDEVTLPAAERRAHSRATGRRCAFRIAQRGAQAARANSAPPTRFRNSHSPAGRSANCSGATSTYSPIRSATRVARFAAWRSRPATAAPCAERDA